MRPESRIGTEIAGYRIEALIGQGGMGEVYLAEHQTLGRMEALKVLSGDLSTDDGFRKRFQREARLAASLRHPNIIPVYSAGESNGSLYLVMPYIRGTDLRRLIDERKQLDPEQTLRILDGVASALDAAHAEGLVHRDVKPANILIEARDGHVYLTDFGVTRHMDSKTQLTPTGRFMGTLHYVAPEQIEGKSVDARTDIYSLGCVLYECLTGVLPFQRESEGSLLWAHLSESPPRLTDRRPDLPDAINLVIARAMAKRKEDRYDSCSELLHEARVALMGEAAASSAAVTPPAGAEITLGGATLGPAAVGPDSTAGRETVGTAAAVPTESREAVGVGVVSPPAGTDQVAEVSPETVAAAAATEAGLELETVSEAGSVPEDGPTTETSVRPVSGAVAAAAAGAAAAVAETITSGEHTSEAADSSGETIAAPRTGETVATPPTAETVAAPPKAEPVAPSPAPETVAAASTASAGTVAAAPPVETVAATPAAETLAASAGLETIAATPPPPVTLQPGAAPPAPPGAFGMPATMAEDVSAAPPPPPTLAEGSPPTAPPRKPGRGRLIAIIVGALVVVGAAAAIVLASSGGKSSPGTATPTPSVPTSLPNSPTPSTSPTASPTVSPTGSPTKTALAGPSAPTGIHAAAAGQSQITLTWHKVSGAAKYLIFVFQAPKAFDHTTATHFSVTGLQPNTKHCYQVVAVGPAGGTSGRSGRSCATTQAAPTTAPPSSQPPTTQPSSQPPPQTQPPATPSNVSVSCSTSSCTVHWSASAGATSYTVSGAGHSATTSGTSVTFSGLQPGNTYCFSVTAHNSGGSSGSASGCGSTS
ncbi:MAG: protein kinase [Actinomycetota bacterium]|nr:protein kinase [Actinomycetota bacterium]